VEGFTEGDKMGGLERDGSRNRTKKREELRGTGGTRTIWLLAKTAKISTDSLALLRRD
jgi:hypothetical protein